jgi:hypothetical protein
MAKRNAQFLLKTERNVNLVCDASRGLTLGHMAVAIRPGRPAIRGKVEAASPRSAGA